MKSITLILLTAAFPAVVLAESGHQDRDTATITSFIAAQARKERGDEYEEARKVVAGDLNGDGVPETIVLYTIEGQRGSNNYIQYLAVFERRNGRLAPLAHAAVGGKLRRSVELSGINGKKITLATLSYGPRDAACCPSIKGTAWYTLAGRNLREVTAQQSRTR